MQFRTENIESDIAVIMGQGRLNMVSAPALRGIVDTAITGGRSRIVVDLSGVDFMDSSGLGALIGCLKTARAAGGDLRITAPTKQVAMVLKLSNLDRVLPTYDLAAKAYSA